MVKTIQKAGSAKCRCSSDLRARVRDWIEREIDYIDQPEFSEPAFALRLAEQRPASLDKPDLPATSEPGQAFVTGLVDAPLLAPAEEVYLFTWMNYLKFRAERSRRRLDLNRPDCSLLDRIDADLRESLSVRNRIVRSNLRLVVSLSRKLSASLDQLSEMIGEGTVPLIRAVELYDVRRGNHFSTYATWAVRNHLVRCLKRRQSSLDRTLDQDPSWLQHLADRRSSAEEQVRAATRQGELVRQLLTSLTERERTVISARFGLDGQPRGQSLQQIARQLGLSKERIRQIALAAVAKLQRVMPAADDA